VWYLTVRPAPARFPAVKRPMPAAGTQDVKRMRMASAAMPAQTPTSTMSASSSVENQQQNPISLLNQYKTGLNYQVIGEHGPPHLKIFTVQLTVDEQVGATKCSLNIFLMSVYTAYVSAVFCDYRIVTAQQTEHDKV